MHVLIFVEIKSFIKIKGQFMEKQNNNKRELSWTKLNICENKLNKCEL